MLSVCSRRARGDCIARQESIFFVRGPGESRNQPAAARVSALVSDSARLGTPRQCHPARHGGKPGYQAPGQDQPDPVEREILHDLALIVIWWGEYDINRVFTERYESKATLAELER